MQNQTFSPTFLAGKVILITGGSRGGMLLEIAKEYLNHGAEAVILFARNQEKLAEVTKPLGSRAHYEQGDVSKIDSVKAAVSRIVAKFGKIDILVNGAAGNFLATAEKLSTGGFRRVLEIDTLGTFHMSQQVFVQSMKARREGVIINVGANLHWNGSWAQVHSAGAKAANDSMTKVLAVEWGPVGIRVNELVPGAIEGTEGFERLGALDNLNSKAKSNAAV